MTATQILFFDIADKANPKLVRQIAMSGALISARRIGNTVHTVVSDLPPNFGNLPTWPENTNTCSDHNANDITLANARFDALLQDNIAQINGFDLASSLPHWTDTAAGGSTVSCQGYYKSGVGDGGTFTTLASVDMTAGAPAVTQTILSRPGFVYASASTLYMAVRHQRPVSATWWFDAGDDVSELSTLHKFNIGATPQTTSYAASGPLPGHVLSQFSMDEYQDHLRVATSLGRVPSTNVSSQVNVFAQDGETLKITGSVQNIAPGEDLRAVRFEGENGYIVTFKKTDPLYTLRLADPKAPVVLGELKIPGFSTYMHSIDATHLLTIGYDAEDQGSFAWFSGVLLQIFDISNPKAPSQVFVERIGTRGSSSEALTNHLAFNYFGAKNLLALPMSVCEGGNLGSFGTTMTFSGLLVYDVTTTTGFHKHGAIAHPSSSTGSGYNNGACSNWWTNATSEVKRSIIMDDFVYSISQSVIKVDALGTLGTDIASISLQ